MLVVDPARVISQVLCPRGRAVVRASVLVAVGDQTWDDQGNQAIVPEISADPEHRAIDPVILADPELPATDPVISVVPVHREIVPATSVDPADLEIDRATSVARAGRISDNQDDQIWDALVDPAWITSRTCPAG